MIVFLCTEILKQVDIVILISAKKKINSKALLKEVKKGVKGITISKDAVFSIFNTRTLLSQV